MDRHEDTSAARQALSWLSDILRFFVWSGTGCRVRQDDFRKSSTNVVPRAGNILVPPDSHIQGRWFQPHDFSCERRITHRFGLRGFRGASATSLGILIFDLDFQGLWRAALAGTVFRMLATDLVDFVERTFRLLCFRLKIIEQIGIFLPTGDVDRITSQSIRCFARKKLSVLYKKLFHRNWADSCAV